MATQSNTEALKQQKEERNLEITTTFWHSVELRLKDLGKSRAWLSKEAGLSAQSLTSAIYLKSKLNIYTVLRITKVLNCTIEDLLYGSSSTNSEDHSEQCLNLIKAVEAEKETNSLASLTSLFRYLNKNEQEAVLVHVFSILGVDVQEIINRGQEDAGGGCRMKRTFNKYAENKDEKLQNGPEWVDQAVIDMWERATEKTKDCNLTFSKIGSKYGFSSSSIYNSITLYKNGGRPRDTDIWIIESIAKEIGVPLNYLVHGDIINPEHKGANELATSLLDNIFSISNGDMYTLFIMALPYLDKRQINSIREDIVTRFK